MQDFARLRFSRNEAEEISRLAGAGDILKALDFDAEHKGAHEYLGELYVETGQMPKAREHLAVLEKLCPQGCEEREDLAKAVAAAVLKAN